MAVDVRKELEAMFSIDATEFNKLVKEGVIVKDTEKGYNIGTSTYNYIKYLKDKQGTEEVDANFLADLFGFNNRRRIDQLCDEGVVVKLSRNIFDANKSAQNFIRHLRGDSSAREAEMMHEAAFREAIAKAQQKEEEVRKIKRLNDIEEAKVIPTDLLLEFLGPLAGQMNRTLDGLSIEFRREFGDSYNEELEKKITEQVDMCKKSLATAHMSVLTEVESTQDELEKARNLSGDKASSNDIILESHTPGETRPI